MEWGGSILVNNDDSFLFILSAWVQERITCQIFGIKIYIAVYDAFPHVSASSKELKINYLPRPLYKMESSLNAVIASFLLDLRHIS